MEISPLISAVGLGLLMQDETLVLLDVRTGVQAFENYLQNHIKGALFVDLNKDLSEPSQDPSVGGRHPLPNIESFLARIAELGIEEKSHVVVYDTSSGANAAARAWWMLRSVGVKKVQVLDGGLESALEFGLPTSGGLEEPKAVEPMKKSSWDFPTVLKDEVKQSLFDQGTVIDVREASRYRGDFEPIDSVAGHIPGAINLPFSENLDSRGYFLPKEELRKKYSTYMPPLSKVMPIVHCGSGVTACHTILAMVYADLVMPALYVGSWSEWSRSNERIETQ